MKKYLIIALLMILGTAYPSYARWAVGAAGGGVAAAAASCTINNTFSNVGAVSNYHNIGYDASFGYLGTTFNPDANISVCRVIANLDYTSGTAANNTYYAQIYSGTYEDALGVALGTSSGVTGSNAWDDSEVTFNFSPAVALTSGGNYRIVISIGGDGTVNDTDIVKVRYVGSNSWSYGLEVNCNTSKATCDASSSEDMYIKIYGE